MIYIIGERAYWHYIDGLGMIHEELIVHISRAFNVRGEIVELHISKEDMSK